MSQDCAEDFSDDAQDSDYDGAWKETLRFHLREVIERGFPKLAALIDWAGEPEWLDKEISQIVGVSGRRNREVDLLFKVRLIDGRDQWVLCHLEIQTSYEVDFASRIDLYNSGLKWMFQKEVLTLVILADLRPQWRPSEHRFELGGFESIRRFPICKLLDRLAADWANDNRWSFKWRKPKSRPFVQPAIRKQDFMKKLNWCEISMRQAIMPSSFANCFD